MFSERDQSRLKERQLWQEQPALVEALCMVFYKADPAGLASGENPGARTEYLPEVEALIGEMPDTADEKIVSDLTRGICFKLFEGNLYFDNWDELAGAIWKAIQTHRS